MPALVIHPKNDQDSRLIQSILSRFKIKVSTLSDEQIEDLGMEILMKNTDRSKKVSREKVMEAIRKK
jgi:hypothetical protein